MNSKAFIYSLICALAIAALYHLFAFGRYAYPEYRLAVGQVADFELIAPFDFPVLKSEDQLNAERKLAMDKLEAPYSVSAEKEFAAYSMLDKLFNALMSDPGATDDSLATLFKKLDVQPNNAFLALANKPEQRAAAYDIAYNAIKRVYEENPVHQITNRDSITVYANNSLRRSSIQRFQTLDSARSSFQTILSGKGYGDFAQWLADILIQPNLQVNSDKYEELKKQASIAVPVETGEVLQNEIVIQKYSKVSEGDIAKLNSYTEALKARDVRRSPLKQMGLSLGMLLYVFIVLLSANYIYPTLVSNKHTSEAVNLPININFVVMSLLAIIIHQFFGLNGILIPFAFSALVVTTLAGFEAGLLILICNALIINPFINWEPYTPVLMLLSTLVTLVLIHRFAAWQGYIRMWILLFASMIAVNLALALYKSDSVIIILRNSGFAFASSALSVIAAAVLISFFEKRWNLSTKQNLLELLDFNHPLLKKLATQAMGTYHHSLVVGNLAERAAEAIGANPLLARVGSYYHDIGKVKNNSIFTENNVNSSEVHDLLSPNESARMIRDHVKEGIILANKYKLPQDVIDIIREHHGSSTVRYFLEQAERQGDVNNLEDFTYPGPRPQSKEAALVMLADIIESTTKAKNVSSSEEIEQIIDNTIQRLILDGQLSDAPITIKDLYRTKQSMLPVLESIYRKRLDYPDETPAKPEPAQS